MAFVAAPSSAFVATTCPVTPTGRVEGGYASSSHASGGQADGESPPKTRARTDCGNAINAKEGMKYGLGDGDANFETRPAELCTDQSAWLDAARGKYSISSASAVLASLIDRANAEPPKMKRIIFLVVRCRRCLQHSRGGDKFEHKFNLSKLHWQWLEGVRERCHHSSVAKTLRIIVDFYMPLCVDDPAFEQALVTGRVPVAVANAA